MTARVDAYVTSLERFGASAVVLSSGARVTLRFPTGDRFANQTVSHADLTAMVEEIGPPSTLSELLIGETARFPYQLAGKSYTVVVEPDARTWKVTITAGQAAASAASAAAAPPAAEARAAAPPVSTPPARAPVAASIPGGSGAGHPIDRMLIQMKEQGASDLHLSTGNLPKLRLHGEIQELAGAGEPIGAEAMMALLAPIIPEKNRAEFEDRSDTDFAYAIPGVSRFRVNLFRDRHGPGGVFRAIPFEIMTAEQLGIPRGVLDLCYLNKGLVVVTGPTGSGKSTTLATLVDHVNQHRKDHIITIEDPIEFVHDNKGCLVNQREVHTHTRSFKDALRAALREDPDIVLVGEMRDLETIAIAVETAETGHLVFGTLHTTTAPSTVDRIIDQFPSDRQDQIRQMLAESLRGVIAQTLCKKIGGGRVAAYEILLGSSAVSNLIRERKTFQLFSIMQTGRAQGMVTLNDSLLDLVKRKLIEPREAYLKAVNKGELKNQLEREGFKIDLA
jgi:twitching motility protein PilT